ncbi:MULTISPECIES: hypothetical protein [unclassified Streptomyces]|uniref:hypothetical protein n=1 Tax=unclassified Streptomyces TaxID=2593676 RepID=UPI000DDB189F|nr:MULTISPECIES: hypothetical protein [unclassified Streptomyces]QZZ26552.1 hypothetical protein A7X85_10045 [Streptomyces sp. ST1015]
MNTDLPILLTTRTTIRGVLGALGPADVLAAAFETGQQVTLTGAKNAGQRVYLGHRIQGYDDGITYTTRGFDADRGVHPEHGVPYAVYLIDMTRLDDAPQLAEAKQEVDRRLGERAARVEAQAEADYDRVRANVYDDDMPATPSAPSKGGRPSVGPAISVAYPEGLLVEIGEAAAARQISRAQWLRGAAEAALPYEGLIDQHRGAMADALRDLDGQLQGRREWALGAEYPREERVWQGEAYSQLIHEMRVLVARLRDELPVREASEAFARLDRERPGSLESARAWAHGQATETVYAVLNSLAMLLPGDGIRVRARAESDDPMEDLEP